MLFSSKKPERVDSRIEELQSKLDDLYNEKTVAGDYNPAQLSIDMIRNPWEAIEAAQILRAKWLEQQYRRLEIIWSTYGLNVPQFSKMKQPLQKCHKVIGELSQAMPELKDRLEIVLVPPSRNLGFPADERLRRSQVFASGKDQIVDGFPVPAATKDWRLMVVYNHPAGLYLGVPSKIISENQHLIAGYDTRDLGVYEYIALSLQQTRVIDVDSWTLLMKDNNSQKTVAVAGFRDGVFRFDVDEMDSVFGDVRFRPAVEIKGA